MKGIQDQIMCTMTLQYALETKSQVDKGKGRTSDDMFVERATSGCIFAAYKQIMLLVLRFARASYSKRESCEACRWATMNIFFAHKQNKRITYIATGSNGMRPCP